MMAAGRQVRNEDYPVGRKTLVQKAEQSSKSRIAWPRWTGFCGMAVRDWLQLLIGSLALVIVSFLFTAQPYQRQQQTENQRAEAEHARSFWSTFSAAKRKKGANKLD
jgi:hypothetical protein